MTRLSFQFVAGALIALSIGPGELYAQAKPPQPPSLDALKQMVLQRDDAYHWEIRHEGEVAGCQYVQVHFVSQRWHDIAWRHTLFVINPPTVAKDSTHGFLLIDGGSWREQWGEDGPDPIKLPKEAALIASISKDLKSPIAVIRQIPFQPMLDGRREDALIAETFRRFYASGGDRSWPLLPAMARAASAAMDATVEVVKKQWDQDLKTFTVTGASKRGWTTYLVGATDPRVKAIAPMVIDMLNLGPQMKHQLAAWGEYSRQIEDYTKLGLQAVIGTPAGDLLMPLVDPFLHREKLTIPKLVILGTNDPYWPIDATRFYYEQLPEPRMLLNVPGGGHGLDDIGRVIGSITALHRSVVENDPMPSFKGSLERETDGSATLSATSTVEPTKVIVWKAYAKERDFRNAQWIQSQLDAKSDLKWSTSVERDEKQFTAVLMEAQYDRGGTFPLSLTTQVYVVPDNKD